MEIAQVSLMQDPGQGWREHLEEGDYDLLVTIPSCLAVCETIATMHTMIQTCSGMVSDTHQPQESVGSCLNIILRHR